MAVSEDLDLPERSSGRAFVFPDFDPKPIKAERAPRERVNRGAAFGEIAGLSPRAKRRWETIPVVLIDKSALFRAGLRHILSGSRFRVVAECNKLSEWPANTLDDRPAVALVGLDHDIGSILPWIRSLKETNRTLRIIVLGERMDPGQGMAVIESGADGYLLRNETGADAVLKSLELVLVEGVVVPHGFAKLPIGAAQLHVVAPAPERPGGAAVQDCQPNVRTVEDQEPVAAMDAAGGCGLARLSERERLILLHLTQGASNKHIARDLHIAEATVKAHVKSLLRKIRVSNRTQAAMWAINHVQPSELRSATRLPA